MQIRFELILPILFLGYIAFFPLESGEIYAFFIKNYILLPFILTFLGVFFLSFGFSGGIKLLNNFKVLFAKKPNIDLIDKIIL